MYFIFPHCPTIHVPNTSKYLKIQASRIRESLADLHLQALLFKKKVKTAPLNGENLRPIGPPRAAQILTVTVDGRNPASTI